MDIAGDRRAQSVQVGVVILFGFLVLAFAGYQATVVPQQNGEVEFNHFEEVGTQVSELRSDAMDAAADERSRSVDVDLGTRYPARSIAVNPSPVSGSLRTSNVGAVEVNSLGTDASALCSDSGASPIESRSVVYRPNYNQYREARNVTFENTFVARGFQNGNRYGPQSLVVPDAGGTTEINLQVLTGSLSGSGEETTTVNLYPSRTFERTFSVTSQFSIVVPSRVPPSEWEDELLSEAIDQGVVVDVTDADDGDTDRVRIHFDPVSDYAVSCSVVGLNAQPAYVPPSSSGSGGSGGPGSGDGAYATVWQSPAGQTGTSSCNEEDCTFDAGAGGTLTLTADTEPTADDTDVVFAVNNTSVATVTPETDTTGPEGEASTDLTPITDGVVKVYASSGGSGDAINVTISNAGGGVGNSLRSASVENLGTGDSEQDLTFTLDRDLTSGETVTIDLSDPQAANQVDYRSATASADTTGRATFTARDTTNAEITYTAYGSENEGDTVTVMISGFDASGPQAANNSPYDVIFEGPAGDTITEQFSVS
jgi:hypothetical protein